MKHYKTGFLIWRLPIVPALSIWVLERVGEVKKRMNLVPQCPVVVVAGTNGKALYAPICRIFIKKPVLKVGTLTSPHLLLYNERIAINTQPVSDELIISSFERIEAARGEISLTYFEFNVLAAVDIFMRENVDVMIWKSVWADDWML